MSEASLNVEIDFYGDWIAILRSELASMGYPTSASDPPQDVSIRYFNLRMRMIPPKPRSLEISKEFTCPPEHMAGLDLIKQKIMRGEDLGPHLSNTVRSDPDYDDLLLNDWGIHHLHLGTRLDPSGKFITRTGPLLFARVTDDTVYLIDVFKHGAWTRKRIIEILHTNWPDSIQQFRLQGIIGLSFNPSESDIAALRSAGVQTFFQLDDGTVYAPLGGGYATSGTSVSAVMESDKHARWVRNLEKHVRENVKDLVRGAEARGHKLGPELKFQLIFDKNGSPLALETTSRVAFRLA